MNMHTRRALFHRQSRQRPIHWSVFNPPILPFIRRVAVAAGLAYCLLYYGQCASAEPTLPQSVLILNQSSSLPQWPTAIINGIVSSMTTNSTQPMSYYIEHLDLHRFSGPQYERLLADYFTKKYRTQPVNIIIPIGPGAFDFVTKLRASLWPNVPIAFTAVPPNIVAANLPPGVTGTIVDLNLAALIKVARMIVPNVRQFAIVGDRFEDQLYYRHSNDEFVPFSQQFGLIDLTGLAMSDVQQRVAKLPNDSVIFYIGVHPRRDAPFTSPAEALSLIAAVANRPIFVNMEPWLGSGAIGGYFLSPDQIGRNTGRLALRVLNGEIASAIPITTAVALKPIFDWRQLKRWNISETRLPAESEIRYRELNAWEQNRLTILAVGATMIVQAALIWWLLYEQRRRSRAELMARTTMSELTQMNRIAIAGELSASIAHEVKQPLTGILTNANAALRWLGLPAPEVGRARDSLTQILSACQHASGIIGGVQSLFRREPIAIVSVDINKLVRIVLGLLRTDLAKHDIIVHVTLYDRLPLVRGDRVQLQQVILNLVMNGIESMHQAPRRILHVKTELGRPGAVLVTIDDTGSGVDPSDINRIFKALFTTKAGGMGMGLAICQSIIERHNGRIWVTAGPMGGSAFHFELPTNGSNTLG
jgi:signal transduction histidine kinase